ncbi:MAG: LiaI-LiaF-like domain-containing protein [Bryobacteraceae bacterium]
MTPQDNQQTPQEGLPSHWIPALVLIAVGAIFLLNNLQIIRFHDIFIYWPVALIAWGIFKVVDQPETKDKVVGAILIGIGGILLMGNLGIPHMGWGDLWPLILIAVGVLMLTDRLAGPGTGWAGWSGRHADWADRFTRRGGRLNESAVFGGGKRVITDPDFQGGKVECVFGGFDIDLRGATMLVDSAVLKVDAVFGGAEIKVPAAWEVDMRGAGVFGAFVDQTQHPNRNLNPRPRRLIVKGGAVFGGVTIKN